MFSTKIILGFLGGIGWLNIFNGGIFRVWTGAFCGFFDSIKISKHLKHDSVVFFEALASNSKQPALWQQEWRALKFTWTKFSCRHKTSVPTVPAKEFIDMHTANIIAVMYRTFINLEKLLLPSSFYFRIFIEYKNFYIIHKHMIMRFFYATCALCFGAFICGCSLKSSPESFCARTVGDCDIVDLSKYPSAAKKASEGAMIYADSSRTGIPFSKDPHVVFFGGRYIMYFSIPPYSDKEKSAKIKGWGIGIAESSNLRDWKKIGEIIPENECEKNGICAPGAVIRDGVVHLFYQTYGNFPNDCICHAWSADGVNFVRNPSNPVFAPDGDWNN